IPTKRSGPTLQAAVFALWWSILQPAGLWAQRWHKARVVSFSIRSQPRRLRGGDSNPEQYRKFKCRLRTNDIVLGGARSSGSRLEIGENFLKKSRTRELH